MSFSSILTPGHYPEDVNARTHPPLIPAEVLIRQAHLHTALLDMEAAGPTREPSPLLDLRAGLAGRAHLEPSSWIEAVAAADLVEEAGELLRGSLRHPAERPMAETLVPHLEPLVQKARQRRTAFWHLDTRRTMIRFHYTKEDGALGFDDGDLHVLFLHAFRLEGLGLALDLGKRPRPLLTVGLPLPAHVGGVAESMDAVLKREPMDEPADVVARLNRRLPMGLSIHQWEPLPGYAAPAADLAMRSHWRWTVPPDQRSQVEAGVAAFLSTQAWSWDRGGSKADAPLDLRSLVSEMRWEDGGLCFSTAMGAFHALNPLKMLGAILGLDPAKLTGLVRTGMEMKPDPRLAQAERFEPKLKNMYEDAVLLSGGSNITLVEEDDDEPLRLG